MTAPESTLAAHIHTIADDVEQSLDTLSRLPITLAACERLQAEADHLEKTIATIDRQRGIQK